MVKNLRDKLAAAIATKDEDRPRRYWTARGAIGTFADVLAIVATAGSGAAIFLSESFPAALMAMVLCGLALTFLALNFRLQRRFAHESRRAQAGRVLARCHMHLRNAVAAISQGHDSEFAVQIYKASEAMATAFSLATRSPCRVAIQDVGGDEHDPERSRVKTLCRSQEFEDDSREAGFPEFAIVEDNTDYLEIVKGADVYFSNDLSKERQYKNSHFEAQLKPHEYPYRSTIVWPIKGPDLGRGRKPKVIGFLCVDSEDEGTFMRRLDVPAGRAVAHAMYSSLSLYRKRQEDADVGADKG